MEPLDVCVMFDFVTAQSFSPPGEGGVVEGGDDELALAQHFPPIEPTAFCIHGQLHKILGKRGRCILHLHPKYATALSGLSCKKILPIDQNTARFFGGRLAIDEGFDGMGDNDEEGARLARALGRFREVSVLFTDRY